MQIMFHVKIKQKLRKVDNISSKNRLCNAKTGVIKAQ